MGLDLGSPTDPAAGADPAAITLATGKTQLLRLYNFTLQTSAVAGNRYIVLQIGNASSKPVFTVSMPAQPASTSWLYSFAIGAGLTSTAPVLTNSYLTCPLPLIALGASYTVSVFRDGVSDVGDQYVNVGYQLQDVNPQSNMSY